MTSALWGSCSRQSSPPAVAANQEHAGASPRLSKRALAPRGRSRIGFLDPADLDAFLAALRAREPVVADLTEVAYFTMLRRGNVLALTWPMIRPEVDRGAPSGSLLPGAVREVHLERTAFHSMPGREGE